MARLPRRRAPGRASRTQQGHPIAVSRTVQEARTSPATATPARDSPNRPDDDRQRPGHQPKDPARDSDRKRTETRASRGTFLDAPQTPHRDKATSQLIIILKTSPCHAPCKKRARHAPRLPHPHNRALGSPPMVVSSTARRHVACKKHARPAPLSPNAHAAPTQKTKVRPQLQSYVQQARAALPPAASPPAPPS
jgi:hypothetical protein